MRKMSKYKLIASSLTILRLIQIFFNFSGRDANRPWQVNDFTIILQKVKFTFPVISHNKYINIVFLYIFYFLFPSFFWNYLIDITNRFKNCFTLFVSVICFFSFYGVKFICLYCYN